MKKIIARQKKATYGLDISLFCIFSIFDILLLIGGILSNIQILIWITTSLMLLSLIIFIFRIIHLHKKRQEDTTLIYYQNKTFYFPTLMLKIDEDEISNVVYELSRYNYAVIPMGNRNSILPVKNNVGKLHITYFFEDEEYYIKLKNVLCPDTVEKAIKKICKL